MAYPIVSVILKGSPDNAPGNNLPTADLDEHDRMKICERASSLNLA